MKIQPQHLKSYYFENKTTIIKSVISIYPGLAAVFFAFSSSRIVNSSRNFLTGGHQVDWYVLLYWITLIAWVIYYFRILLKENETNKKNIQENREYLDEIKSAIHNAPNPKTFDQYYILFKAIEEYLISPLRGEKVTKDDYHEFFQIILERICSFTNFYNKREIIYGASIMLYVENTIKDEKLQALKKSPKWLHFKKVENNSIMGILRGVPGLTFSNFSKDGKSKRNIPSLIFPIIKNNEGKVDMNMLLPGACRSAEVGIDIFNDVSDIGKYYGHLSANEQRVAKDYFSSSGSDIKSIASFAIRIGGLSKKDREKLENENKLPIVGVLNIDSNEPFVLGPESVYHSTYWSLIMPILYLLSPFLKEYKDLYINELIEEN